MSEDFFAHRPKAVLFSEGYHGFCELEDYSTSALLISVIASFNTSFVVPSL